MRDQTNQTAFICQNNKKVSSLALSHIYMSIKYYQFSMLYSKHFMFSIYCSVKKNKLSWPWWKQVSIFPTRSASNIPQNPITILKCCGRSEVLSLVRKDVCTPPLHFIRLPWQFTSIHLYSWVERGMGRAECLALEQNTFTQPGLEPRPLKPESSTLTIKPQYVSHCC